MNQENLKFLADQMKYTGFGEGMESVLKEKLEKGETEFKLSHDSKFGNDSLNATLNFKKSDQSNIYFFNSYQVNLQKDQSKDGLEQTFYINKGNNITLKEAFNLMNGRSVNKDLRNREGEVYNSWIKINFKENDDKGNFKLNHYHQNYGYDLEASLAKHPIKELNTPAFKEDLMNSLKKGNIQSVTFLIDGADKKQFVEANPHFKTINVYDSSLQRIKTQQGKDQKQSVTETESTGKDSKKIQENDNENSQAEQKAKPIRKKKANSI